MSDTLSPKAPVTLMRFQIGLFWIAYSNVCVFVIVSIVSVRTGGETAKISLCFQMKTYPCIKLGPKFYCLLLMAKSRVKRGPFFPQAWTVMRSSISEMVVLHFQIFSLAY